MKYKKRPITKQIITSIKQSGRINVDGKISYLGSFGDEICYRLNIKPAQLYRAVSSLIKQHKLIRISRGFYNLPLKSKQCDIQDTFWNECQAEIDGVTTANQIDKLLRIRSNHY